MTLTIVHLMRIRVKRASKRCIGLLGLAFTLMMGNSVANRLVWADAELTFQGLWGRWLPLLAVVLSGALMLFLDCRAIFAFGDFDRTALEGDFDKAESWLKSWMAPA